MFQTTNQIYSLKRKQQGLDWKIWKIFTQNAPDRFVELRATSTGCFFKALCRAVRRMAKAKAKGVATWSDEC